MAEIMARINAEGHVELITDQSVKIEALDPMLPMDAAYLARGILACAVVLSGPNPPKVGAIGGDAHIPIITVDVRTSKASDNPVLMISIPSGLELTFEMPPQAAKQLGEALISWGSGQPAPPAHRSGMVH